MRDKVREFYQSLSPAMVGMEATSKAIWFENLLAATNYKLVVGNPGLIGKKAISRHKADRRDAGLMLNLLNKGEFPPLWRRSAAHNQVLARLKARLNARAPTDARFTILGSLSTSCAGCRKDA